jgi:hypothetical protein
MNRTVLAAFIALSFWATPAWAAVECRAELPRATTEYWSWRIIDGKRCWYPGRPGMSKSNLRWSERTEPPRERRQVEQLEELRNFAPRQPASQPKVDEPWPKVDEVQPNLDELPFAERWPF